MVLVATGHLKGRFNNKPISALELDRTKIGKTTFEAENIVLSAKEKVAARFHTKFGLPAEPGREVEEAVQFLIASMLWPGLPAGILHCRRGAPYLTELRAYSGNQVVRVGCAARGYQVGYRPMDGGEGQDRGADAALGCPAEPDLAR